MPVVTEAVELAWQVAADEAIATGYTEIEPLHLLIGICSIGELLDSDSSHRSKMRASSVGAVTLEWRGLTEILASAGTDPMRLRHAARNMLSHGSRTKPQSKVGRSEASRRMFERAEHFAQEHGPGTIGLIPLLAAIVDYGEASLSQLGERTGVPTLALKGVLLRAAESQPPMSRHLIPSTGAEDFERISLSVDATSAPFGHSAGETESAQRLALFYELPLQFGAEMELSALLNKVVEKILQVLPRAKRAALLVRDPTSGSLLLQAHLPAGEPAVSTTLAERAMQTKQGFVWSRPGEVLSQSLAEQRSEAGMYAPLVWRELAVGVICVDNCEKNLPFSTDDLRLLVAIAHHAAMAVANQRLQEGLQRKSTLLERLLTNFSPRIREKLQDKAAKGRLALGGEKSEVTILFSDIRGFTLMSAAMDAEDIVGMLNHYFSVLVSAIFRYDGTIDKFIGDSILAVFGSPEPDPLHHEKAVRAALEMQAAMISLNQSRSSRSQPTCNIGIGVHCGAVLHGFIGSPDRMEFTVVGDPVNRAARYCAGAEPGEVLISPELHQRVWKEVDVEACTVSTKHEGTLSAYRVKRLKPRV